MSSAAAKARPTRGWSRSWCRVLVRLAACPSESVHYQHSPASECVACAPHASPCCAAGLTPPAPAGQLGTGRGSIFGVLKGAGRTGNDTTGHALAQVPLGPNPAR